MHVSIVYRNLIQKELKIKASKNCTLKNLKADLIAENEDCELKTGGKLGDLKVSDLMLYGFVGDDDQEAANEKRLNTDLGITSDQGLEMFDSTNLPKIFQIEKEPGQSVDDVATLVADVLAPENPATHMQYRQALIKWFEQYGDTNTFKLTMPADDGDDGEKSFAETWQDYVNKKAAEDAEKAAEAARAEEEAKKQEAAQVEKEEILGDLSNDPETAALFG